LKDDRQRQTPFFTKLKEYGQSGVTPFDVPGHKLGRIKNDLLDFTGANMFLLDSNAPIGLDQLAKPVSVIKEAEKLAAQAFHADRAYFLVNGTSVGIMSMIMSACRASEEIILPRNVHKSIINGLILSGATPVFVHPDIDADLGIANGIQYEAVKKAIETHPNAKAVFVINPTYFGFTSDLKRIVELAHQHNMQVICDEAHGTQFYFSDSLPISAMDAGADMSTTSVHKTGGSLTQSSMILTKGDRVDHVRLRTTINMLQSTSPSSLLIASLDVARKTLYFEGEERIKKLVHMAQKAREQIRAIPGITVIDKKYVLARGGISFDETKLVIKVSDLGITGFEAYKELRRKFNIQLELAETHLILAILTMGTTKDDLDHLTMALKDLSRRYYKIRKTLPKIKFNYQFPASYSRPRDAYHAPKLQVKLEDSANEISGEMIMIYPPGIPMVIPGEIISEEVLEDLQFYMKNGSVIHSEMDNGYIKIVDKEHWKKWEGEDSEI
jgi:lysine decarboxylase